MHHGVFIVKDQYKTKKQLIAELKELRSRIPDLNNPDIEGIKTKHSIFESEERFRKVLEQSFDGFSLVDDKGIIIEWNKAQERIVGLKQKDVLSKYVWDVQIQLVPTELKSVKLTKQLKQGFFQALKGKDNSNKHKDKIQEQTILSPSGVNKTVQTVSFNIFIDGEIMIGTIMRDITLREEAKKKLKESEERFRTMFETNHAIMLLIDPTNGKIEDANPAACKYYGYSHKKFIKEVFIKNLNTLSEKQIKIEMENALNEKRNYFLFKHKLASGKIRDVEVFSSKTSIQGRELLYSIIHDISKRKKAEEALYDNEKLLRQVIDASPYSIYVKDREGRYILVNKKMVESHNTTPEKLVGRTDISVATKWLTTPEKIKKFRESELVVINKKQPLFIKEDKFTFQDGSERWYQTIKKPISLKDDPNCIMGVAVDITERKLAEEALKESEERFKFLFEYAAVPVWLEDFSELKKRFDQLREEGIQNFEIYFDQHPDEVGHLAGLVRVIDVNQKSVEFYQAKDKVSLVKDLPSYFTEESLSVFQRELVALAQGEDRFESEIPILTPSGEKFDLIISLSVPDMYMETLERVTVSFLNITERKHAEEVLLEQVHKTEQILQTTMDGYILANNEGELLNVNPAYCQMIGYSYQELLKMNIRELEVQISPIKVEKRIEQMIREGGARFETKHKCKDGQVIELDVSISIMQSQETPLVAAFVRDITERMNAEDTLRESEKRFQSLIQSASDGIITSNQAGLITLWNSGAENMFGYHAGEIIGKSITKLMPASYRPQHKKGMQRLAKTGKAKIIGKIMESEGIRKDGSVFPLELSLSTWQIVEKRYFAAITRDITQRKQVEETLQRKTQQQNQLIDSARHLTATLNIEEVLTRIGKGAKKLLQAKGCAIYLLEPDEKILRPVVSLEPPYDEDILSTPLNIETSFTGKAVQAKKGMIFNRAESDFSGQQIPGTPEEEEENIMVVPFLIDDQVVGAMCLNRLGTFFSDDDLILAKTFGAYASSGLKNALAHNDLQDEMQERKQAEEEIKNLAKFPSENPNPVLRTDKQGRLLYANEASFSVLSDWNLKIDQNIPKVLKQLINKTEKQNIKMEDISCGENIYSVSIAHSLGTDHVNVYATNITERKKTEVKLLKSEQRYRMLVEGNPHGIQEIDNSGIITFTNPAYQKLLGYSEQELKGKSILDLIFPESIRQELREYLSAIIKDHPKPSTYLQKNRTKDGRIIDLEVDWNYVRDNEGHVVGLTSVITDITERKLAGEDLRESEEKYRLIVENAHDGIEITQKDRIIFANTRFAEMLGFTIDELKLLPFSQFFTNQATQDLIDRQENRDNGKSLPYQYETTFLKKDGTIIDVDVKYEIIQYKNNPATFAIIRDITKQKKSEEEKIALEKQLRRSQKLETIGTLAGGIAHDFNNILAPIMGYTDMAMLNMEKSNPLYDDLQHVLKGAHRAKELVEQILLFSKQSEKEQQPLALQGLVKEALKLLRPSIPTTIEIRQRIDETCSKVLADATQIHQVIVNLCTNAWQSMEEKGGILTITLNQIKIDPSTAKINPNLNETEYIQLSFSDTGGGMDNETLDRIFEPFFTTKAVDKGTGLGLSVVHGIVQSHRGDIHVYSEEGMGSVFHVYLPILVTKEKKSIVVSDEITRGSEFVIIVDDEVEIANLVKRMLENFGYNADIYQNGIDALKAIKQQPGKYDLLISDLTMPQMNGLDLADQIHKNNPKFPILIMTGFGDNITLATQKKYGIKQVIGKPIIIQDLTTAVRSVLDE
jgi:PAS domain S-box-containing protein